MAAVGRIAVAAGSSLHTDGAEAQEAHTLRVREYSPLAAWGTRRMQAAHILVHPRHRAEAGTRKGRADHVGGMELCKLVGFRRLRTMSIRRERLSEEATYQMYCASPDYPPSSYQR